MPFTTNFSASNGVALGVFRRDEPCGLCCVRIDKRLAVRHARRISERTLLLLCAAGGSAGGWAGMYCFRHKTRKRKFYLTVPLLLALQIAVVYAACGS